MEKINRDFSAPELQPILVNWKYWGTIRKQKEEKDIAWKVQSPEGEIINLRDRFLNKALIQMTKNRCPFCDFFPLVDRAHFTEPFQIEHFFPKELDGDYWLLAYQWENLFPICQKCNNEKGNKSVKEVVKPDLPTYDFDSYFDLNSNGNLETHRRKPSEVQRMADATIKAYNLNRGELKENRRKLLRRFELLYENLRGELFDIYPLEETPYQFFIKRFLMSEFISMDFDSMYDELRSKKRNTN